MSVPQAFDYTPDEIRSWGDRASYDAACRAADRGFVGRASYDPATRTATGAVTVGGDEIETAFAVSPRSRRIVENRCSCPAARQRGVVCVHMLAVAVTLQRRAEAAHHADRHAEEEAHARRVAEAIARGESLRRDLVAGTPSELLLAVPQDWRARFADGQVPLRLFLRRTDRPGEAARPVAECVERGEPVSLSEQDDTILFLIEDMAEGSLLRPVSLPPQYFVWVLDVLGRTGRPLYVERGAPLRVRPKADAVDSWLLASLDHETGEILLALNTGVPGAGEGTVPDYVLFGPHGYAFHKGVFWPLRAVLPHQYQGVYDATIAIPRIGTRTFVEHELAALRKTFDVQTEFDPDLFTWTPAKPSFRLLADATNGSAPLVPGRLGANTALKLELRAVYDPVPGHRELARDIEANAPVGDFSIPDPGDPYAYFVRNPDAERAALASLPELGLSCAEGALPRGTAIAPVAGADELLGFLASTVPGIEARPGWSVGLRGALADLSLRYDRIGVIVHAETPGGSPGSFDLAWTFRTASSSREIPRKEVFLARAHGKPFVKDAKGRELLFDPAAVAALDEIEHECGAMRRGDGLDAPLRFGAVHAPYVLAALERLASSNVRFDKESAPWLESARAALSHDAPAADAAVVPEGLRKVLRPYQRTGVAWLRYLERNRLAGVLADEMGLGKTLQTLAWLSLERFHEADRGLPALVVCPTSLVDNWARESARFTPELRTFVHGGADRHEFESEIPRQDLVITSYAILRRDVETLSAIPFSAVVLDEAQNIKNQRTQNALAAKRLQARSRLVLTGTPIENSLADLWSILDFLMRGYLGSYEDFKAEFEAPASLLGDPAALPGDRRAAQRALDKLRDRIRPFLLRRLKADVAKDLPPKIVQNSWPELTPDQRRVYDRYFEAARGQISESISRDGFQKSRMVILTALLRLRQVCCHLALLGENDPLPDSDAPSGKMEHLFYLLDEAAAAGHRTLVFSQFVEMLHLIRDELEARGTPFCYLDGQSADRLETVHRFNTDPSIPVFLISLKAGGTGLNLTGADEVVLFDPWWNPSIEDQAIDRAHRIGQKRTVHAFKLITPGTVEEKVLAMQQRKRSLISATIGATDASLESSLTLDDVKQLFDMK